MNTPNPYLTELYNNAPSYSQEDLEKVAAVEALEKLAEENEIDLDSLSDEEVGELLQLVMDPEAAAGINDDDEVKEAQARLEEADFLGRVMAHANHQESEALDFQKVAAAVEEEMYFSPDDVAEFAAENGIDPDDMDFEDYMAVDEAMQKEAGVSEKWGIRHALKAGKYIGSKGAAGGKAVGRYHAGAAKGLFGKGKTLKERAIGAAKFSPHAALAGGGGYAGYRGLKGKKKEAEGLTVEDVAAFAAENYDIDPEQMDEDDFEYVADLMEKDAMLKEASIKSRAVTTAANMGIGARKAGGFAKKHTLGRYRTGLRDLKTGLGRYSKDEMSALGGAKFRAKHIGRAALKATPEAALLTGGGGYALSRRGKKKTASVLDEMIEGKALEMLAEAGYEVE